MATVESTAKLFTTAEVARLLRVHPRTVRDWCAAGALPTVRVGSHYRIPADALEPAVPPAALTTPNRKAA